MGDPQNGVDFVVVLQLGNFDGVDAVDQHHHFVKVFGGHADDFPLVGGQFQRFGISLAFIYTAHGIVAVFTAGAADDNDRRVIVFMQAVHEGRSVLFDGFQGRIVEVLGNIVVEGLHGGDVGEPAPAAEFLAVSLIGFKGDGVDLHFRAFKVVVIQLLEAGLDIVALHIAAGVSEVGTVLAERVLQGDDRTHDGHALTRSQDGIVALHAQQAHADALLQWKRAVVFQQHGAASG